MIDFKGVRVLVIAPHPDDEVIGCGGLIARVKASGGSVYVMFLTVGATQDFSGRGESEKEERVVEIKRVAGFLKVDGWRVVWPSDQFHLRLDQVSQREIIHEIERGKDISLEELKPDLVVFPTVDDYNQDHRAAAAATLAACRPAPRSDKFVPELIWQYELPMNQWLISQASATPNVVVKLSRREVEKKARGMELYASQVRRRGHLRNSDTIRALAQVRGALVGEAFGEAYFGRMSKI